MTALLQKIEMDLIVNNHRLVHQLECTYDHRINMLLQQKRLVHLSVEREERVSFHIASADR